MTPADFLRIRTLYGESQLEFGKRLGFEGAHGSIRRKVRRYELGETPIVGTMAALLAILEGLAKRRKQRA